MDGALTGTLGWIEEKLEMGYSIHDVPRKTVQKLRDRYGDVLHAIGPDGGGLYTVSLHGLYSERGPWTPPPEERGGER